MVLAEVSGDRPAVRANSSPTTSRLHHEDPMTLRTSALASAVLAMLPFLPAQGLSLDKYGGAVGGSVTFRVQGAPGAMHLILLALNEARTPVPSLGITLDIPTTYVAVSLDAPGFLGDLDANGAAAATIGIPADPGFAGLRVSAQAIADASPFVVSNLVRVTVQQPGTFAAPLRQPLLPIIGGGVVAGPDGSVLFAGGSGPVALRYQSRTEEWSLAGATFSVGQYSQTTGLPDGRVLFTGGLDLFGQPTAAAAIYDPVAQTTTRLQMNAARAGHGASVMGDGRVLITGGFATLDFNLLNSLGTLLGSTEIFDPATGTFAPGPTMAEPRAWHSSTTLTNGQVLIAGGLALLPLVNVPTVSATAYRFNPASGSFGLPATLAGGRFLHSAVPLSDGKVLLVGGASIDLGAYLLSQNIADLAIETRADCQLYSPTLFGFGTFATVNGMQEGRAGAAVAPLPGGRALIAGGFQLAVDAGTSTFRFVPTASADVFGRGPNRIEATGPMAQARQNPMAVSLPDGTVMVVGGLGAEIYQY
jgi:hypothetical protein